MALLDELPESALAEVASFIEYQRYKLHYSEVEPRGKAPFRPTPMGGLLKGANITDEDIRAALREMWGKYIDDKE